jgi:uncharacterized circularly permuted ATP-grasp superfamily protein
MENALAGSRTTMAYEPDDGYYDEAFAPGGEPRPHYAELIDSFAGADLEGLCAQIAADLDELGMRFRANGSDQRFPIDPVPRVLPADEWELLERGLAQRARALNAFLVDAYGDRSIVAAGHLPARVIDGAELFERDMCDVDRGAAVHAAVAGFDLVRHRTGEFEVLEDNLRTPSGTAYCSAAREVLDELLPFEPPAERARLCPVDLLGEALRDAAPDGVDGEPCVVLLSDGAENSAWWEHVWLGRALGIPVATPRDIEQRRGEIWARDLHGESYRVDVVYRRTDIDTLRDEAGAPTWVAELLLEPIRRGTVACVNAFGNGLADDKLVHAYVEEMIRFYLGEEPLVPSVPTFDPGEPDVLDGLLDRIDELVVKPRTGSGGEGVVVCPHASREDIEAARRAVRNRPEAFVLQETVAISTHPTAIGSGLEPRHVDLRPFAYSTAGGSKVLAGGLTRVALDRGALVVNSSQNGGGKDTWMLT